MSRHTTGDPDEGAKGNVKCIIGWGHWGAPTAVLSTSRIEPNAAVCH